MSIKIAAICGSARPGNLTSRAMALVLDELRRHPDVEVTPIHLEGLDLPMPGQEARDPAGLERLQSAVAGATGVLLASPEYHGGVSSPMKLAIDNLGFPSELAGKPVALLGVAAGAIGAIKSLEQLRGICAHTGALVLPETVSVARAHEVFGEDGACLDEGMEGLIRGAGTRLIEFIRTSVCPSVTSSRAMDTPRPEPALQSTHVSFRDARAEFERAWNDPAHTRVEPEAVDVNRKLREAFVIDQGQRLTGEMLWDAEVAKAWDPGTYIPGVVRSGESWGKTTLPGGDSWFVRSSQQVPWRGDAGPGVVLEEVYLDPAGRSVLFLGRAALVGPDGEPIDAGTHQPLFHVEHAVTGPEDEPRNRWRIVHLTGEADPTLVERHLRDGSADWVLGFLATFVETRLGWTLTPRAPEKRDSEKRDSEQRALQS